MRESKDSEVRRDEFVAAAEKLFRENGIVETTINAIVKEMDVAKGLFYYYFESKDDVIDAISEKYNLDFRRSIERSLRQDEFDQRLDAFIEDSILSFRQMWEKLRGANDDIDLSILASRSMDEAKKTASSVLEELLEEGNSSRKLNIMSPKLFAEAIIAGMTDLDAQSEATGEEIKKIIEGLIRSGKE